MDDIEGKTFEAFTRETFGAMAAPGIERLVVDLRRNGGGNNYLAEALRKRIERSAFNRPGGLYVLVGPRTFSAAQNCANRLERETFATFVGEPTGGAPNHYGDAALFTGEVTGISAIVSTLPWFDSYPQDTRPWILPDLPVSETFADWQGGRDAALQRALTHQSTATADELDPSRIFYFRRESQKDWRPFWRA
jgi:C-terminal processing protease CtpA/Prc